MKYSIALFVAMLACASAHAQMFHQDVSWSPDGKYLAFTGLHDFDQKARTHKADVYVIRTDGSDLRKITGDEKNEYYTSWAKGRIAFGSGIQGTKQSDIFISNPDGSDLRQLTKDTGRNSSPSLRRDGKRIAFVSNRDGEKYQLYTMNADGSNVTRLTNDPGTGHYNPQWSPDGKRIVYYAEIGDSKDQIWVMNADGSNKTLLTANVGHNIFPGWGTGGKIIFSSSKREAADGSFLYTVNSDGSAPTKLATIQSFFGRYSPDGKKIAYISGKFPETAIYIANVDGSGVIKVTN